MRHFYMQLRMYLACKFACVLHAFCSYAACVLLGSVRRLRFSASRQSKSLVVAKLPDRLKALKQPVSITKDIPVVRPNHMH